ncbi:MAG: hypothetical protein ACPGYV_06035, partial [Phycisphaeraceae bacterium]
ASDSPSPRVAEVLFTRREPENAPHVPSAPGRASAPMLTAHAMPHRADLVLCTELTQAVNRFERPSAGATAARPYRLIDTLLIPDTQMLS